jgi:dual specificity tyrosine-phosphorylation-regulated kinase 2/3/4
MLSRNRSVRKLNNAVPPSPRTTTLYAFGSSNSTTQLVVPRESPTKLSRSGSFNMPFRSSESLSSSTTVSRGGRSIPAPPSPTPNLGEFGHKLSMSTSFQSPTKRPTPHKRTGTTSSITVSTMGPPPATERAGKLTPATPTANRHKPSIEKLPLSPTSAKNKLSVSTKDISHSRRGSLIPGASGLGARTISPTDASRLARRLSQPPPTNHTIIVSEDEPLPTLTASTFEKKFAAPMNTTRLPTLKTSNPPSRTPSPSPPSNRDSLRDSGIGSSASGTISSGHPSPNTVFLEAAKSSRRKSLVVVAGQNGVPPVPPIPKDISEKNITAKVGSVKTSPKNTNSPRGSPKPSPRYKSPPPPLPSQSVPKTPPISSLRSRDHGLTLSTSIPSYVNTKAQTARETSSRTTTIPRQLEPSNLPPFKVSALATPTVQRVNALVAKNSTPASTGKSTPPHRTVTTPQTAVTTRFPRGPRTPATPSLTPPIIHPSGVKTASAAPSRRSIPSPGSLLIANRKASFIEKHVSNSSLQNQVTKLPAHEEEKESPKSVWRSVSRGTGKLVRRSSVTDKKIGTPKKKEEKEKEDAMSMPAPTLVPKRNLFGLARKGTTAAAKDLNDRNTALTGSLSMTRQSSSTSTATATPPPPRYSPNSSNPSTDDELLGGNSREMEIILRSASSKYRNKIERDLEELESVRRRVVEFGDAGMKDPVTPVTAVKIWGRGMSTFEKGEVVDYPNVWYCSDSSVSKTGRGDPTALSASKTPENATSIGVANFGFDDEIGNYVIVQGDHLAYRYEITGMLGKGSFGQVCKCVDHKTGKVVAVKIIRNKQRFHTQALVEVNILQKLCQWVCSSKWPSNGRTRTTSIISFE